MKNLQAVNLFIGKNSVGKSSLLEAIHLAFAGHKPDAPLNLATMRGFGPIADDAVQSWGWYLANRDITKDAELLVVRNGGQTIRTTLGFQKLESISLEEHVVSAGPTPDSSSIDRYTLLLKSYIDSELVCESNASMHDTEIRLKAADKNPQMPASVLVSSILPGPSKEEAERFSRFEQSSNTTELIGHLQLLQPKLQRVYVSALGGVPHLRCDFEGGPKGLPLSLAGEGMRRLLRLVVLLERAQGGTLLVDEIDTGIHYSILDRFWSILSRMLSDYGVQLFAATHNKECIHAAARVFKGTKSLGVIRLEEDHSHTIYDADEVLASEEFGLEIR